MKWDMRDERGELVDNLSNEQERSANPVNVDEVFENVTGEKGLWQGTILLAICLSLSVPFLFPVYANAVPRYRCKLDEDGEAYLANKFVSVSENSNETRHLTFDEAARMVGPWFGENESSTNNKGQYGCLKFKEGPKILGNFSPQASLERCVHGYVYERNENQYPGTIVVEWDLVCDNSWRNPLSTSIYMFGMLIGSMTGGFLAGKLGRKKAIYLSTILESAFGLAVTFSPSIEWYTVLRFFVSVAVTIKIAAITVIHVEMTTAKYRALYSAGFSFFFQCVYRVLHAWIAMYVPNWRYFHLIIMTPAFLGLVALLWIPESPRWLISQNKEKDALKTLYKAYKVNSLCKRGDRLTFDAFLEETGHSILPDASRKEQPKTPFNCVGFMKRVAKGLIAPYQTRDIAKRSLFTTLLFTGQLCVFFGLLFFTQVMRSSVYYVSMINAATSVPGIMLSTFLYSKYQSRRKPMLALYSISAVILLAIGLYAVIAKPESEILLVVCSNIALILLGATFNMIFIYTSELFPSSIRSQGLGNATGLGRIGGMLCSYINELDLTVGHGVPVLIYGGVTVLQVLLTFCLPDTDGKNLADKVISVEKNERDSASTWNESI